MKNKKGIFLIGEKVLNGVLAVGAIFILVLLLVSLTGPFTKETEIQQAKAVLSDIFEVIDGLEDGKIREINIEGFDNKWYIIGWDKRFTVKPDACSEGSCICICRGKNSNSCRAYDCKLIDKEEVNVFTHFSNVFVIDVSDLTLREKREERDSLCINLIPRNIPLKISKSANSLEVSTEISETTGISFGDNDVCFTLVNFPG